MALGAMLLRRWQEHASQRARRPRMVVLRQHAEATQEHASRQLLDGADQMAEIISRFTFARLGILFALILLPSYLGCRAARVGSAELPFKPLEYSKVVAMYDSGELAGEGKVSLPANLRSLTADSAVYVTTTGRTRSFLFVTWRGKGRNLRGYIYFPPDAVPAKETTDVTIIGPSIEKPWYGDVDVVIEPLSQQGWYSAMRDLD